MLEDLKRWTMERNITRLNGRFEMDQDIVLITRLVMKHTTC